MGCSSFCSTDLSQTSLWSRVRAAQWKINPIMWFWTLYSCETTLVYEGSTLKYGQFYKRGTIFCHILPVLSSTIYTWYIYLAPLSVTGSLRLWRHWPNITLMEAFLNQNCIYFLFLLEQSYNSKMLMTGKCQVLNPSSMMRSQRLFVYCV